ncbi:MAG: hypothetical protein WCI18_06715 [Pseudomonadota bacterium]
MKFCRYGGLFLALFFWIGCGVTKTTDSVIRRETDVLDVRIFEGNGKESLNKESSSLIGFDENGLESRLLIYFPKLLDLWASDVIVSSISIVELILNCTDITVNPENIELLPMTKPWGPYATWTSIDRLMGDDWANAGGDVDLSTPAITPSFRLNTSQPTSREIAFDITALVKRMILEGTTNYGFQVRVKKSDLNSKNAMNFSMSNNNDSGVRPSSILTFSQSDTVEP